LAAYIGPKVFGVPATPPSLVLAGASPVNYVTPTAPPFLIIQGAADPVVAESQSQELAHRLEAAHDRVTLDVVQNGGHGLVPSPAGAALSPSVDTLVLQVMAFFQTFLGRSSVAGG
jgi:predicted esterase